MLTGLNDQVVSVFVDDIEIKGMKGSDVINKVKAELITAFSLVDIGPISFYLGLNVERDREKRIIKPSTGLDWENSLQIPFWSSQPLQHSDERIGNASTPNWHIAFSTAVVSQFIKNPSHQHIEAKQSWNTWRDQSCEESYTAGKRNSRSRLILTQIGPETRSVENQPLDTFSCSTADPWAGATKDNVTLHYRWQRLNTLP